MQTTFTTILIQQTFAQTKHSVNTDTLKQLVKVNQGKVIEFTDNQVTVEFPYPIYREAFTFQAIANKIRFYLDGDHYVIIPL